MHAPVNSLIVWKLNQRYNHLNGRKISLEDFIRRPLLGNLPKSFVENSAANNQVKQIQAWVKGLLFAKIKIALLSPFQSIQNHKVQVCNFPSVRGVLNDLQSEVLNVLLTPAHQCPSKTSPQGTIIAIIQGAKARLAALGLNNLMHTLIDSSHVAKKLICSKSSLAYAPIRLERSYIKRSLINRSSTIQRYLRRISE